MSTAVTRPLTAPRALKPLHICTHLPGSPSIRWLTHASIRLSTSSADIFRASHVHLSVRSFTQWAFTEPHGVGRGAPGRQ